MFDSIKFADRIVFGMPKELEENLMHKFSFYYTQPRQIEKLTDISFLETPHLVCEPTKKNYYLFLTNYAGNKYCLFIDTCESRCFLTKFRFNTELFKDTVFQGEFMLLNQSNKWVFRINDLLAFKGNQINSMPFSERLGTIKYILDKEYIWDEYMNTCSIDIKSFFTYDFLQDLNLEELWFVPEHMFDPIIYINNKKINEIGGDKTETAVLTERHLWLYNTWKPDLFEVKDDNKNDLGYAYIKTLNDSKELRKIMQKDPVKMLCKWNEMFQKWMPIL